MRKLVVIVFLVVSGVVSGQSVTGTSGLIHIPSARMLEDGQLVLGAAFIPKPYFISTSGYNMYQRKADGLNTYITYGILPFAEVMFRYTHELGAKVNVDSRYFPDRMLSLRFRLLKEKNFIPSIVIGLHDISSITGETSKAASFNIANYIVISKSVNFEFGNIDITTGHTFDIGNHISKDLNGFFGGLKINFKSFKFLDFNFEYDTSNYNLGLNLRPIKPINLMIGIWDLNKPTFSFNYLF